MHRNKHLLGLAAITSVSIALLRAQAPQQPRLSAVEGNPEAMVVEWDGIGNRTYFLQTSPDLVSWVYLPFVYFGNHTHGCGIETTDSERLFFRLKYISYPWVSTQGEAEWADFDGDWLSNIDEVTTTYTDPFNVDTDGDEALDGEDLDPNFADVDNDGMEDRWEIAHGFNPWSSGDAPDDTPDGDPDNDGIKNKFEYALGWNPVVPDVPGDDGQARDSDSDGMPDSWEAQTGVFEWSSTTQHYEFRRKLDWENQVDATQDPDGDGLDNLSEYQNGTNPFRFDTDDDQFSDSFEVEYALFGYNPLIANPSLDIDGDGLSDLDELIYGTSLDSGHSDSDGYSDSFEIENGSDPLLDSSFPFMASSSFGAPISTDAVMPMGDLRIASGVGPGVPKVRFVIRDGVEPPFFLPGYGDYWTTNQEQWGVKIDNTMSLITSPGGTTLSDGTVYPYYSMARDVQLSKNRTHEVRLQHLGVIGLNSSGSGLLPDFRHYFLIKGNDFLMLTSDPNQPIKNPQLEAFDLGYIYTANYNFSTRINYLVPITTQSYSTSYAGNDATGPRFRKISQLGRPIPDSKPESEAETDEASEESYVDAFDLSLHHDTSFVSIPLAASDLRLEANASVRETTWSNRAGLRPDEEITSPFGIGWSSNLCAYIETVENLGNGSTRPTTVNVVDEGGRMQRFGTSDNLATFFPWPSSVTDKKTCLNTLVKAGNDLILQKKFGNKLTYRKCDAWFMYGSDRLAISQSVVRHQYWRLVEVEDRFGAKVQYEYGNNPYSLIPVEIVAVGRVGQKLIIDRSANGRRIHSIQDPEGNITRFIYATKEIDIPETSFNYSYQELSRVDFPGAANVSEHYAYDVVVDPEAETIGSDVTRHLHGNLKSVRRDGCAERVFSYTYDRTKKWYDYSLGRLAISASLSSLPSDVAQRARDYVKKLNSEPQAGAVLRKQYGLPRLVSRIKLQWTDPDGAPRIAESSFAKTELTETVYGPSFSSTNGTNVTDAEGKKYTYSFGGIHGEIIDTNTSQVGGSSSVSNQWLVYHSSTTLTYKDENGDTLGSEVFEFDPASGLSLKKTVDFCGNVTNWTYGEDRPAGQRITLQNNPEFLSKWSDPTKKTDALNRTENYEYGSLRMLAKQTDIHGVVTEYVVDALGRRREMTVKGPDGILRRKETYDYDDSQFSGFMTRKTVKAFSNLSGKSWEQDLIVEYVPDSYGRVWKEKVDPSGKNLITIHTYDMNNRKRTATDARALPTQFDYDERGRLEKTTFADSSFKSYGYDANSQMIRETDENGNSTLIERDGLGRIFRSARDMNSNGLIDSGDLITQFAYDDVGLMRKKVDPRGFATVTFYDDLHRAKHVFGGVPRASSDGSLSALTSQASSMRSVTHRELFYEEAKNTGGGLLNPFKPTKVSRYNVVSMNRNQADASLIDITTYDDVYRPVETRLEYAPGFSKNTLYGYGTVNTSGQEPLVSTVTDTLGKITQTTRDALGREVEIIDGFGNSNPDLVLTTTNHYSSTGLLWRTVDPMSRHFETEYDSAGRAVKAYQPDPVSGLITGDSPVTESELDANGNVIAVIDPLLRRTDFDYDNRNRKWRVRQPLVSDASNPDAPSNARPTTIFHFDDAGNEIAMEDARGSITRKFYDKANRIFRTRTNPETGNSSEDPAIPGTYDITTTAEFDDGGLALSVEDGNGNVTRNAYDSLGRLIATACDPSDGNPAALPGSGLDPAAYRSSNSSCALVSYLHDDSGNTIEVTDGEGHQTAFTFDGFNRKTSIIWDPGKTLQRTETFEFDALVHTSRVDGRNHRTNYEYDDLYRLTDVVYRPDTSGTSHIDNRRLTYDKAGKVLSVTYPNDPGSIRNVTSVFDKLDRLTSESSAGVTHTYPEYDKAGNRKQTTYGRTGTTLVSTYDALNRLQTCEERSDAGTPSGRTTSYAYDLGGLVTRKTLPNGNATTTTRDKLGRSLIIEEHTSTSALVSSFDYSQSVGSWPYSHDALGNVLRCAENHTASGMTDRVVSNTYDHCHRLIIETITPAGSPAVTTGYEYDLADNRVLKTVGSAVTEYQFGNGSNGANSNQLREYGPAGQAATHAFTYDNNGNRETHSTVAGAENYTWDEENRLTSLDTPAGDYAYTYDHRSRRVVRDESAANGSVTELTFSGGTSVQEASTAGAVQVELIRGSDWGGGIGGVLFTIRSGTRSYNAYNSRGDVVSVTNDSGTATWQAAYEAFGTRTEEEGNNAERQRANTKDEDPTGLLNEGFRYRDLEVGVFISRDPAGFVDGPNVYAYVRQNPWTAFDPEGLSAWSDFTGYWKGVGIGAGHMVTGVATMAWENHPLVNVGQLATGSKTGYQKNFESGIATAKAGYNLATSSQSRSEAVQKVGNTLETAWNEPEKFGELAFNVVSTAVTLGEGSVALASKLKTGTSIASASAKATDVAAKVEVAVIVRTPAQRLADKARSLSASERPNTVAVIKHQDGTITIGRNQGGVQNTNVQSAVNQAPQNAFNGQCAELNALARAQNKGRSLEGAEISVSNVRGPNSTSGVHGTPKPPCETCTHVLDQSGVEVK